MGIRPTTVFSLTGAGGATQYADKDAIGTTAISVRVPTFGVIETALFFDLDDEGLQVDLWLFTAQPSAQTDNSQFSLTDAEVQTVIDVIPFTTFQDAKNGQVSIVRSIGTAYWAPSGTIYAQAQSRGAPTISTAAIPAFQLHILTD